MPFKMNRVRADANVGDEQSVSSLFDPIISELREYLENLAKAE